MTTMTFQGQSDETATASRNLTMPCSQAIHRLVAWDAVVEVNANRRILDLNCAAEHLFEVTAWEMRGACLAHLLPMWDFLDATEPEHSLPNSGCYQTLGRRYDGTLFSAEVAMARLGNRWVLFVRKGGQVLSAEPPSRALQMLRGVENAIVCSKSEQELLARVSTLALEVGYAAVGVHCASSDAALLSSWHDTTGQDDNPTTMALPLVHGGCMLGALSIRAREPDAFDDQARMLLMEATRAIACALASLRAGAARQAAEARLTEVLAKVGLFAWQASPHAGHFTYLHPHCEHVLGRSSTELLTASCSFFDLVEPEDRPVLDEAWSTCQHAGRAQLNIRLRRPDGERCWVFMSLGIERDAQGEALRIVGIAVEITAPHPAELVPIEPKRKFREIAETVTDVFWVGDVAFPGKLQGTNLYMSPAFDEVWGLPPGTAARGVTMDQIIASIHPGDRANFLTILAGHPYGEPVAFDHRIVRPDGSVRYIHARTFPVRDATGQVIRIVGTAFDVTERRRAEEALRALNAELEERVAERTQALADLYDNAPCGYHTTDREGVFQSINATELRWLGYSREELIGVRHFTDLVVPEERVQVEEGFAWLLDHDAVSGIELRFLRKDGTTMPGVLNAVVVRDTEGNIREVRASLFDDTERRRALESSRLAAQEAERASRAKDEFLAAMSHELRTPLNAILSISELLSEAIYGPINEKQCRAMGRIQESGCHLLSLINDVLDVVKLGAGQLLLERGPVHLAELCRASLSIVSEAASEKCLSVTLSLDDATIAVVADEHRLQQVLVSLLSNAVKFTPKGGKVGLDVTVDRSASALHMTVWDTGIGISSQDQARLFQPFVQLDASLARQYNGTGLGLSLVRQLMELHGGSVRVTSEQGMGSQFTVSMPLVLATAPLAKAPGPALFPRVRLDSTQEPQPPSPRQMLTEGKVYGIEVGCLRTSASTLWAPSGAMILEPEEPCRPAIPQASRSASS